MIVFDLKCEYNHVFEAWFANSDAFVEQREKGLLSCPLCGSPQVEKAVMAPNVAPKGNQRQDSAVPGVTPAANAPQATDIKALMQTLAKAQAALLEKSEWVGKDFASKARAMDAGEIDQGLIHGQTTPEEAKSLIEDGIGVVPLPFPVVPPEKQN